MPPNSLTAASPPLAEVSKYGFPRFLGRKVVGEVGILGRRGGFGARSGLTAAVATTATPGGGEREAERRHHRNRAELVAELQGIPPLVVPRCCVGRRWLSWANCWTVRSPEQSA